VGVRLYDGNDASLEWREYIEAPLTTALVAGEIYQASMWVSLADTSYFATDSIGMYFSNGQIGPLNVTNALPYSPQVTNPTNNYLVDKDNWVLISGTFTALGGENSVVIGNFLDTANTSSIIQGTGSLGFAYVFIDDIELVLTSTVPVPAAVWLFGSGLFSLLLFVKVKRNN